MANTAFLTLVSLIYIIAAVCDGSISLLLN